MGDQNKILNVTYGKFSCRIEGFDDAVETMKAVVSYFHDLAGHENFLEVAPDMPDLNTLAKMAEAQSGGTVTATPLGTGVSLSRIVDEPSETADGASQEPAVEAQADDTMDSADPALQEVADDADTDDMVQEFAEAQDDIDDDVSLNDDAEQPTDLQQDEDVAAFAASEDTDSPEVDAAAHDDAPSEPIETAVSEYEDDTAEPALEDEDDDSFSSKLERIRAVVSRGSQSGRDTEEEPEATPVVRGGNPLAQRLAELAKRNSELTQAGDRRISPLDEASDAGADDDQPEGNGRGMRKHYRDTDAERTRILQEETPVEFDDTDEAVGEDQAFDNDDLSDDLKAASADQDPPIAAEDDDTGDENTSTGPRPLLLTTPQHSPTRDAREDDEDDDDFDLSAELAEIEKELANRPRNGMGRHGLPRRVEDAMSRIFTETNQQLDEPEGRRHRDALAQLKAAVAATEAAKQLGDNAKSRDAGATFRDDLGALDAESGKNPAALPPLKLVKTVEETEAKASPISAPRVSSKPLDTAADRLREIAAGKESSDENAEGFADFLDKHGVIDLSDKLEAAAAYLTFVEGENDFTRPQLMRLVQSASREEITREDGLRCFGRLLRQARFAKLNNGRFKVDDNTPFRPRSSRMAQG